MTAYLFASRCLFQELFRRVERERETRTEHSRADRVTSRATVIAGSLRHDFLCRVYLPLEALFETVVAPAMLFNYVTCRICGV
jgi:hypothetical protein